MNGNLAYREEPREELMNGELVAMSPRPAFNHNHIAFKIAVLFDNFLKGKTCTTIADGTDLYLSDKDVFVPDMMVVCDRSKIQEDGVHGAPDLVVEVLSPSTAKNDRTYKKDVYAKCGVQEYWLVSPAEKSIEVYYSNGADLVLHDIYTLRPAWMLEQMQDKELAAAATHFPCRLFDGLDISLYDIFDGLLP